MSNAPKNTGWIISGLKNVIDRPLDPTLVDSTHKLLDILNKAADRLPKLLNKRAERGYTLLHFAAERNQPESLKCQTRMNFLAGLRRLRAAANLQH